jgi:transposase
MYAHSPEMGVSSMLDRKRREQMELFVAGPLEKLIPEDHILRQVDRVLDLSWLREEVAGCYCADNGRPGLDPEVVVRLMLAGLLLGYAHDRRLLREAQAHLAIRWFIGYRLDEELPDHSSLTRIRQRWGEARFKEILRRTVQACVEAKVATGEVVHMDASLIRADVSWESLAERHAEDVVRENDSEDEGGKKGGGGGSGPVSRTDPDARLARKSARAGFEPSYKHHAVVDDERGVVLDVAVTEGTLNEREMMEPQLDAVCELTGRAPAVVTADSGYAYSKVYGALERRGVDAVIPAKKEPSQSRVPLQLFRYDERHKVVKCPGGKTLRPRKETERGRYYVSRTRDCAGCALKADCLSASRTSRTVLVPHEYPALLRARRRHARRGEEEGRLWRRHMGRSEGYHGEAKSWHGLARAVRRGLANMKIQAYLTAAAVNLKRLAAAVAARIFALWRACAARKRRMRVPRGLTRRLGFLSAAA